MPRKCGERESEKGVYQHECSFRELATKASFRGTGIGQIGGGIVINNNMIE